MCAKNALLVHPFPISLELGLHKTWDFGENAACMRGGPPPKKKFHFCRPASNIHCEITEECSVQLWEC